jgi:hypothetical protein
MSLWLSKEELIELTGHKAIKRQKMALGQMNVPFRSRASDGYPLVDRWRFEGEIIRPEVKTKRPEMNWAALEEIRGNAPKKPGK